MQDGTSGTSEMHSGAKIMMLTNAAGGEFDFHPGDLMLITDQITTAVPTL